MNTIVIDTNILIAALIRNGLVRESLNNHNINFIFPEYGINEIYCYKDEIMTKAEISEREFNILLLRLLKYIKLIPLEIIIDFREEADKIIGNIHKEDAVFIATALAFNCPIWSDDNISRTDVLDDYQKLSVSEVLKSRTK